MVNLLNKPENPYGLPIPWPPTNKDPLLSKLNFDCEGSLFVGEDNSSESGLIGFSGLLSKFTIFNYELNKNDIYKEYRSGPINGILASLGIGAYGIRNPIYKLNANSSNN